VSEKRRIGGRALGNVHSVERRHDGDDLVASAADRLLRQPLWRVARRVIGVAVVDGGEVEAGDPLSLEDREIRVVGQPAVDFDPE
jgi:hypothetical protein